MFKWVWLIILGSIWFKWFCLAIKDVVITIKWCKEYKANDFYNRLNDTTYAFFSVNFVILFLSSLIYWIWSL